MDDDTGEDGDDDGAVASGAETRGIVPFACFVFVFVFVFVFELMSRAPRTRRAPDVRLRDRSRSLCIHRTASWIEFVVRVSPNHAGLELLREAENLRAFVRPNSRAEPVHRVVGFFDGFVRRAERENRKHGTENFFARDAARLRDAREESRCEPKTFLRKHARRGITIRFALADLHELFDFLELHLRVDRADVGVLVERIAEPQRRHAIAKLANDDVVHALFDEQARARAAHVTFVEINSFDDSFDGLIDGRVREDDVRGFSAELEREASSSSPRARAEFVFRFRSSR